MLVKAADELAYLRLLLATKSVPSYRSQLRANARALWNGTWDEFQFYGEMLTTLRRNLTQAFQEGAASCGIRPNEYSDEERARLEAEIANEVSRLDPLTDFIVANSRANGGKLATVYARLELWTNAYTRVKNVAQTLACGDIKLKWHMNPLKEHCFAGDTPVLTEHGWKPIRAIEPRERVWTPYGLHRVKKVEKNLYYGELYRVGEVVCTAGHSFLTEAGWIKAKELCDDTKTHVALPNADDGIAAFLKVGILRSISFLLYKLTFRKRHESGMTVPIVSIGLNDDVGVNQSINDKLWLDQKERLVLNSKSVEMRKERGLKLSWFIFLNLAMTFYKFRKYLSLLFRVLFVIFPNLIYRFLVEHRIIRSHIILGGTMNKSLKGFLIKRKAKLRDAIENLFPGQFEYIRDFLRPKLSIITRQKIIHFFSPYSLARHMLDAIVTISTPPISANLTLFPATSFAKGGGGLESRIMDVSTLNGTETWGTLRWKHSLKKRRFTVFAHKIFGWIRILSSACHLYFSPDSDTSIISRSRRFEVYNLEVDCVHQYIVQGGFIVHNCGDCRRLDGRVYRASTWAKYDIYPRNWDLECRGVRCGCAFEETDEPCTPGFPPHLSNQKESYIEASHDHQLS